MLSISTCWNSARHTDGAAMLRELVELGFERVELGHGIRLSLMEGIQRFYGEGKVTITSLHNFCPLPVEILHASPDCYQFSSHREAERERALKQTFQTIDFAARLGARFVVMHLGTVPMRPITEELIAMAEKGEHLSRRYTQAKLDAVKTREAKSPLYLGRGKEALKQVAEYAAAKNIKLGVEGRMAYEEIPSEREIPGLLDELNAPNVGYWHDFGHIQVKHNLGFLDHFEWLSKIAPRLIGCHLHDVVWPGNDHRAPFTGMIDYDKLIPLLPKNCLFIFEMSPRRTKEEITESLRKWKERFGE
jgi:sugar phosphate isomerase/epimerase